MYKVFKDCEQIAIIEKPVYIKSLSDGTFTPATEADCQGIAVDSVPYNLFGCTAMAGVTETVVLCECDGGMEMKDIYAAVNNAVTTANSKAPMYTYGTEDIEAGSASTAATGTLHFVYE